MANITLTALPKTESAWLRAANNCKITNPKDASIHSYDHPMSPGSKIGDEQFLLLHILWNQRTSPFNDDRSESNSTLIITDQYRQKAESLFKQNAPWNEYLYYIENKLPIDSKAEALGLFFLVLQSQQYTQGIADERSEENKVEFSPRFTRSRAAGQTQRPRTPLTPTPTSSSQATLTRSMDDMDIDDTDDEFSPSPSPISIDQPSPISGEAAKQVIKIRSEQEVVVSLLLFQRASCMEARGVSWHPHQDGFTARDKVGNQTFTAYVDGVMRSKRPTYGLPFNETKRGLRYATGNGSSIKAQESCQLAASIAQEPPKNLEEMRAKNLKARKIWYAQNKHEIYIMKAVYDADYVDYITDQQPGKLSFAKVDELGPYPTDNAELMEELGIVVLGHALQQADEH